MQMFQQPDRITMIYRQGHEVRHVRMNQPHPAQVTPSWYGDSVGHYEGDTLVIDTVGIKIGPFAMVDMYGTPHTGRCTWWNDIGCIDYDDAKEAHGTQRQRRMSASSRSASTPTTGARCCSSISRSRMKASSPCRGRRPSPIGAPSANGRNLICAENRNEPTARKESAVPTADKPDF